MTHVVLTGPITGLLTLEDGTVVNVSPTAIEVTGQEQADEISFLIGEHWVKHGHPDDVDEEENEDGERVFVQNAFVHDHDPKFDNHPAKFKGKPAGRPHHQKG